MRIRNYIYLVVTMYVGMLLHNALFWMMYKFNLIPLCRFDRKNNPHPWLNVKPDQQTKVGVTDTDGGWKLTTSSIVKLLFTSTGITFSCDHLLLSQLPCPTGYCTLASFPVNRLVQLGTAL